MKAGRTVFRASSWFAREAGGLVPIWLKVLFGGMRPSVPARMAVDDSKILLRNGVLHVPFAAGTGSRRKYLIKNHFVDLEVPPDMLLERRLALPMNSHPERLEVARLDLLRRTPFAENEVKWTIDGSRRRSDAKTRQWIAKQSDLETILKACEVQGIEVVRFLVEGEISAGALWDRSREVNRFGFALGRINALLFVCLLAAAVALWLKPAWEANREMPELEAQKSRLQAEALTARQRLEARKIEQAGSDAIVTFVFGEPTVAALIAALSDGLPDDTWITEFSLRSSEVVLRGSTQGSAATLVAKIADASVFSDAALSGAVARDATGAERFQISAKVRETAR